MCILSYHKNKFSYKSTVSLYIFFISLALIAKPKYTLCTQSSLFPKDGAPKLREQKWSLWYSATLSNHIHNSMAALPNLAETGTRDQGTRVA